MGDRFCPGYSEIALGAAATSTHELDSYDALVRPLAVLLFYGTVRQQLLRPERYEMIDGVAEVDR